MCIHKHESSTVATRNRNETLSAMASKRLWGNKNNRHLTKPSAVAHPIRSNGAMNKGHAKLASRVADWQNTLDRAENRGKDMSGYHKPGSLQ